MNCANHAETAATAFCRTCGKPLCATCTRDVRGVIYCENCLAARMEGTPCTSTYTAAPAQVAAARMPGSGPNSALAGILAGFFPFGVGAVYNGQYAKGLAHLLILFGLIWGQVNTESDSMHVALGLAIGFFYIYQIIDAVRSARAIQVGQPAPDPFGLGRTFSPGDKVDTSKIPVGAVILIGLGVLFMLQNLGLRWFSFDRFWPLILIGIGIWLFVRRWGAMGIPGQTFDCERCRARALMGPAVLVTLGILFLLEEQDALRFHKTWPILLVVIGLVKIYQSSASDAGHLSGPPAASSPSAPPVIEGSAPPSAAGHTGEVRHG